MIAFIDEFAMVPPSVRGPWRTRRPRGRADTPIESGPKPAACCRSPHGRIARTGPRGATWASALPVGAATTGCAPGSRGCTPRTSASTGRAEGLAAAAPGGRRGGPMHGGAADAGHGAAGRGARQAGAHHRSRRGAAMPEGQGGPAVRRARAGSAVGERPHPCRHLVRLRPRRLRDRRPRAAHRGPGGSAAAPRRASSSTRSSRRSTSAGPRRARGWSHAPTGAASTPPSGTRSAWPRPASSPPWARSGTAATTPWPRP